MNSFLILMSKVKINPFFWLVIGTGIVTGYFKEILMIFLIVFVHEMGHSVMAHFFKWRIKRIELLPFGGVAEVEEYGNRPFKEEFLVIIAGPLQHLWLIGLSFLCASFDFWTIQEHETFVQHNLMILSFNLLPIWPLDGGKLLFLCCSYVWSFREAHKFSLVSSFSLLCIGSIISLSQFPFHLNLWIVIVFLFVSHYLEWRQRHYVYMRFLMERYYSKPKRRVIKPLKVTPDIAVSDVLKKFRRGFHHMIVIEEQENEQTVYYEQDLLKAFFEKKKMLTKVGELYP